VSGSGRVTVQRFDTENSHNNAAPMERSGWCVIDLVIAPWVLKRIVMSNVYTKYLFRRPVVVLN
jgi:hypothetical protein